jgi:hypothetical protein
MNFKSIIANLLRARTKGNLENSFRDSRSSKRYSKLGHPRPRNKIVSYSPETFSLCNLNKQKYVIWYLIFITSCQWILFIIHISISSLVLEAGERGTNTAAHSNIPNFTKRSGNVSNCTKSVRHLAELMELERTSDGWANIISLNRETFINWIPPELGIRFQVITIIPIDKVTFQSACTNFLFITGLFSDSADN